MGEDRIGLRGAEHEHAVAGADGGAYRIAMGRQDVRRLIGQRKRDGHLPAFGIDKDFCDCLRCHVSYRGVQELNVDDRIGRKGDALAIGDRAGNLSTARLGMAR